ncbi:MAG: aconitase family protein, partial [Geminicoccaceae bacterium]
MRGPLTLFDKIWLTHEVDRREDGASLLWVDRHLVHEGSHHAFRKLAERGLSVARPELTFGMVDHYAPTRDRERITAPAIRRLIDQLVENCREHDVQCFELFDPRQGIVHVVGPEQGMTLPGLVINCGDSHTSTHGAFGSIAFGIGATEVSHVLATQTIWQKRPAPMRISIEGALGPGVGAKDVALGWIARLGADGARGHAIEYAGSVVREMSMEERLTLCNLSIEGGARCGMVAPDETTLAYIRGRPFAPQRELWDQAACYWSSLRSDEGAAFDREVTIDAGEIAPIVTWGTSPEDALPITGSVPDLERVEGSRAERVRDSLD